MGLLPDTWNYGLHMRWECWELFPRHRLQRKPLFSDPGMHHGTCVTHVPWCMSGSLTHGGGENVPGIPGACATSNFTYLVRGPYCWFCTRLPCRNCWYADELEIRSKYINDRPQLAIQKYKSGVSQVITFTDAGSRFIWMSWQGHGHFQTLYV